MSTNQVPAVSSVLAWLASATNYFLEYTDDLSPTNVWRPVSGTPTLIGNQLVVTNTSLDAVRFCRLFRFDPVIVQPAAPVLSIQPTSTNTFLLSLTATPTGFALQQNSDPATTDWVGTTNPVNVVNGQDQVIVPPVAGAQFYRLKSQ